MKAEISPTNSPTSSPNLERKKRKPGPNGEFSEKVFVTPEKGDTLSSVSKSEDPTKPWEIWTQKKIGAVTPSRESIEKVASSIGDFRDVTLAVFGYTPKKDRDVKESSKTGSTVTEKDENSIKTGLEVKEGDNSKKTSEKRWNLNPFAGKK